MNQSLYCENRLKKVLYAVLCTILITLLFAGRVNAESFTTVVMTYEDKVFSKQLYAVDTDRIKQGVMTEGLQSIGGLCDNLTFQTNGAVQIDKNAVISTVKEAIIAGKTDIRIDLSKYTPDAIAASKAAVVSTPALPGIVSAVANTGNGAVIAQTVSDPVLNATLNSIGIDCKLSEATTKFNPSADRAVNVRNAANKINGTILLPGQGFSASMAFGPRTVENGYGLGNVISGGKYVKSLGGGICQVSSTLNLAVLRAGIIPTERHNHSHRSDYIGSGLDATISAGTLDYQFVNTLAYPLYIMTKSDGGVLTISLYSNHDALLGVSYDTNVVGDSMTNTTYVIGTLNGVQISNRKAYNSRYSQ